MSEEADHPGVGGGTCKGHVAVPEGAVNLQVEPGLGRGVAVLPQGFHPICGQVKVETVGANLRSGHLTRIRPPQKKDNSHKISTGELSSSFLYGDGTVELICITTPQIAFLSP